MKKYYVLILSIIQLISVSGQSIVDTNKQWSNLHFHYYNFSFTTEFIRFTIDTVIGSGTCKRVEISTDPSQSVWSFYGYARETTNKKIYYRINSSQPEKLLYDMNVQVGDSLQVFSLLNYQTATFDSMMYYVTAKDSLLIGNKYQIQYHLSKKWPSYFSEVERWVDSVGSIGNFGGMLHNWNGYVGGDSFTLLCFLENSVLKYHLQGYSSCYIVTGVENSKKSSNTFSFKPNPLIDVSKLNVERQFSNLPLEIEFYDSAGRLFTSTGFTNELIISKKQFNQGLYYYLIFNVGQMICKGQLLVD